MADIRFEFTDTDNNTFVDWDCVWRSWIWKVFKTVVHVLKLKYIVHAVGKKTRVVDKF